VSAVGSLVAFTTSLEKVLFSSVPDITPDKPYRLDFAVNDRSLVKKQIVTKNILKNNMLTQQARVMPIINMQ
jgi:hypothetical protein